MVFDGTKNCKRNSLQAITRTTFKITNMTQQQRFFRGVLFLALGQLFFVLWFLHHNKSKYTLIGDRSKSIAIRVIDSTSGITSSQEIKIHPIEYPDSDNSDWAYKNRKHDTYSDSMIIREPHELLVIHYDDGGENDSILIILGQYKEYHIGVARSKLTWEKDGNIWKAKSNYSLSEKAAK